MNTATGILSPKNRKPAYFIYGVIGLVIGCLQVILAVYGLLEVKWFLAASGVYGFLGTAFGFVAGNNVVTEELEPLAPPEAVETDLENEEEAPMALVNDEEPIEAPEEFDATPVDDEYEPRH